MGSTIGRILILFVVLLMAGYSASELLIEVKKKDIRGGFDLGGIKQKKFC